MKKIVLPVFILFMFAFNSNIFANVYASEISINRTTFDASIGETATISFILNENADNGVGVEIYNSSNVLVRTITITTGLKGLNSVEWDGKDESGTLLPNDSYSIKVTASDDGYTSWTKISTDTMTVIYSPKGIAINRNPNSPSFGVVYISNGTAGTSANAGAFYNQDGFYKYHASQDTIGFFDGGEDWTGSASSPWKLTIGPDDNLYVADFGRDLAFEFDQDISPNSRKIVINDDNKESGQYVAGIAVAGTGADRAIYTADGHYGSFTGIKKYDIGTNDVMPAGDTGYVVIERPDGGFYQYDVEIGSDGSIYFDQYRANVGEARPLLKYPAYTSGPAFTNADAIWDVPSTYTGAYGMALDEANNRVAFGDYYSGNVYVFNATTGEIMDTVDTGIKSRDIAFDAVGNLYNISSASEYWYVTSPPSGPNSYTTSALTPVVINNSLPVELTSFTASAFEKGVQLNWATATELNNKGFEIQRSADGVTFSVIAYVNGYGTSTEKHAYSYVDETALNGSFYYRLKQVDLNGTSQYSSTVEVKNSRPEDFTLSQNYPNPFNPTTTIAYTIPQSGMVNLSVYNLLGEKVVELVNEFQEVGARTVSFNASNLASGTYIYRLTSSNIVLTKKMILMK